MSASVSAWGRRRQRSKCLRGGGAHVDVGVGMRVGAGVGYGVDMDVDMNVGVVFSMHVDMYATSESG